MENEEVKYWQPRFRKWINSNKWDYISEKLSDTSISIIRQVMNAEKDGDCSWVVWHQCGNILERIRTIEKQMNKQKGSK